MFDWIEKVFCKQKNLQEIHKGTNDLVNIVDVYNSATSAVVEIGEMLQTNTTWKKFVTGSKKEPVVNEEQFLEELADVFIYMFNVCIYAGVDANTLKAAINKKQDIVIRRFVNENDTKHSD